MSIASAQARLALANQRELTKWWRSLCQCKHEHHAAHEGRRCFETATVDGQCRGCFVTNELDRDHERELAEREEGRDPGDL